MSTISTTEHVLRWLFFTLLVRPLVLIGLGLNVRHRARLPDAGPAILVANHNSHLDTLVLMTLLPSRQLGQLRPVAAMDYFLRNRMLAWFAQKIIGIIPLARSAGRRGMDSLDRVNHALGDDDIVILFPEGSRGQPEVMAEFKRGVAWLAEHNPEVPVIPVYLHGLGKALPRGETLLVPFFCDVFIGEAMHWHGNRSAFTGELKTAIEGLAAEGDFPPWT